NNHNPASTPETPINVPGLPSTDDGRQMIVYRAGKLPKELEWFQKLDLDGDGQVGLWEWVKAGKSVGEFREMDRNDDGFITAEEVFFYARLHNRAPSAGMAVASNNSPGNGPMMMAFGMPDMNANGNSNGNGNGPRDMGNRPGNGKGGPGGRGNGGPGAF